MRKRTRRGGMIRKVGLTDKTKEYRVISVDIATNSIQAWGTFTNFNDALTQAQEIKHQGIDVYVHGDANRVISKL